MHIGDILVILIAISFGAMVIFVTKTLTSDI